MALHIQSLCSSGSPNYVCDKLSSCQSGPNSDVLTLSPQRRVSAYSDPRADVLPPLSVCAPFGLQLGSNLRSWRAHGERGQNLGEKPGGQTAPDSWSFALASSFPGVTDMPNPSLPTFLLRKAMLRLPVLLHRGEEHRTVSSN